MLRTPNIEHERITTAKTRSSFSVDALQFYFSSSCKRRGNTSLVATLSFRESKECARAGPEELSASPSLPKTWERQHHVRERSRTFENEQACPGLKRLFYILSFLTPTFPPFVWKKNFSYIIVCVSILCFLFFFNGACFVTFDDASNSVPRLHGMALFSSRFRINVAREKKN